MSNQVLGEFEQMVLLAILRLDGEVYGVPIMEEIERCTGKAVGPASVYVALRRLEQKGFIRSWMSGPTSERGGKPRRCVQVEQAGVQALRASRQRLEALWRGLDPALDPALDEPR